MRSYIWAVVAAILLLTGYSIWRYGPERTVEQMAETLNQGVAGLGLESLAPDW